MSMSRGIPRLRRAICGWYQRRFDVDLDSESQAIVSIGSKEGLAHLALATMGSGEAVLVPNPAYPIHPFGFVIAGADIRHVPLVPGVDFFAELEKAIRDSWPKPKMLVLNFPGNPTTRCVDLDFFVSTGAGSGLDLEHGSGVRSRLVPLLSYSCGHGQATATGMSRCAVPPHRVWQPHCTRYHIGGKPACTTKTSLRLNWKIAYRSNRLILSPRV
jgi:hypothetical protein